MLNSSSDIGRGDQVFFKDSLNATFIRKVDKEIVESNQNFVRRLQDATSQYSQKGMKKYVRAYEKAKTNMAFEKMDPYYDL